MRNHAPGIISAGLALSLLLAGAASRHHPAVHAAEAPVSYSNQIAPIVFAHCTGCHHPEGAGPFSLLSYSDAKRWGPQILTVTQSRYMPPWLPEPGHGDFADDRRLSDHDRELLRVWVTTGMPQGDPAQTPPAPT